jgi:hypothetical protein
MTKLNIILGVSCLLNVCWSTQASEPANATPFACPEEVKTPSFDSSVAFYASTPMECQMKSIHMKAYANVWADIGVCFPLFDEMYKDLPGPVTLNSDHWCFDKSSINASPVFHEALAMKRVNGIGKKKNIGIEDGNKKTDNTENKKKKKKKKQNRRNRKKGTRDGGQDTNDRKLYTPLSQGTDYSIDYTYYQPIELEELAGMTMYLQTNDFNKFQPVPIEQLASYIRTEYGLEMRGGPIDDYDTPEEMTNEDKASLAVDIGYFLFSVMFMR